MRATVTPPTVRKGKRRLLDSCAIAAGLAAIAYGGPALAQVAANPVPVSVGAGSSVSTNAGTKTTTVNVTGAQSIYNWVPTDTAPTGGDINVLPSDSTWNFSGNGNYVVLNRFTNGSGGSLSRQIALNGTVNSTNVAASGAQGGSIWFYNAGGILIGSTGVINVGSLVLTTNDIVTTGGLFDTTTGAIRFRGAAGSTSTITVNGAINASQAFTPGSSYVALVAPRVVQAGTVTVDGSAGYVAAEQADIRINGGLFDINVLVGAEGGNVITHSGVTTGPEQQAAGPAQRIYMVAIPKNVAVGMLVSGQVGYQDGATAAITNSDGSVVLSAGYNIANGVIAAAPVNATAANITVNDTIFRSNVVAHASGAFVGQPLAAVAAAPPQAGRLSIQGDGTFIGDASATLNITGNRIANATGTLTVQSNGRGGVPGNASINVDGATLVATGGLSVVADGVADATTGNSRGGTAVLTVNAGGTVATNALRVSATGTGDLAASGAGGTGSGGTARITVGGASSSLSAIAVNVDASGFGGGVKTVSGVTTTANVGGEGQGGSALVTVQAGGSLNAQNNVALNANGVGGYGSVQSGDGTGGTARLTIANGTTGFSSTLTTLSALGIGGGSFSQSPIGTFFSPNGGDGTGGTAEVLINADNSATLNLGTLGLNVSGFGGGASGSENIRGGSATGGTATLTVDGGVSVGLADLAVDAGGESGGASSPSSLTGLSGNAQGGTITIGATGASTLQTTGSLYADASGTVLNADNVGSGAGGDVTISATNGATIRIADTLTAIASGGSFTNGLPGSAGNGTGGNIDLVADNSGTITTLNYNLDARATVANVSGSNGTAQGGRIAMTSLNGGLIASTSDGIDFVSVDAQSGYSQTGGSATGGDILIVANEGSIALANPIFAASGVSGGALAAGATIPTGTGGTILVRTGFDASSQISFGSVSASADGRTQAFIEGAGDDFQPAGNGQGGTINFEANGGNFTASGPMSLGADGFGGIGPNTVGRGGTASFTQIGGVVQTGDVTLSADGIGGVAPSQSGDGFGGNATMTLTGGTFTGGGISVSASGYGGFAFSGDDFDVANPRPGGNGGNGYGGTARIEIAGNAVVDTAVLGAYASGNGAAGGDFYSNNGVPGTGGNAGIGQGGNATVSLTSGELDSDAVIADAGGFGGNGGSILTSTSSGFSTGAGVGGTGGDGFGGTAAIELNGTVLNISESLSSRAIGSGGNGGGVPTSSSSGSPTGASVGGNGGNASGGLAQAIVNNFDAGTLALVLDTSAFGGTGGDGSDGDGGRGGDARGGTSRIEAIGGDGSVLVSQANFETSAFGGNGGSAFTDFFSRPDVGGRGGDGGSGTGGEIQIVATDGATVGLGNGSTGGGEFSSTGTGGDAGRGADNPGTITLPGLDGIPGTPDDVIQGLRGGDGGIGGGGIGGTVYLFANGGTITSNGSPVDISVNGRSGIGGNGGTGSGGGGNCCSSFTDIGGLVKFEALVSPTGTGQILLGDTVIQASGGAAGRIQMRAEGNIAMASLAADAFGFSFPTTTGIDASSQGIFFETPGGTISTADDMALRTDSSVGVYAQAGGRVTAGGDLTIEAGDGVDLRHSLRGNATNATLFAEGDVSITAFNSLRAASGTLLDAGGTLLLTTNGPSGSISVDRIDGDNILVTTAGLASIEHAEAQDSFTANVGSFRTGLNSIITGGNISITAPGSVDLGNSTAGGSVSVSGLSIAFNIIDAGSSVDLTATGTDAGAEGIRGVSLTGGSSVFLNANSITIGSVASSDLLSAFASGGNVAIEQANAVRGIGVFAQGDITGSYAGGEDIFLRAGGDITASASAIGGGEGGGSSSSGSPTAASVFADAGGNVLMSNSQASGMFGVNAGGSVEINDATVGEDMLVLTQGTANLSGITVGDDLDVRAAGAITAAGLSATGLGSDGLQLTYSTNGFTISQGEGASSVDGADINLQSFGASINASGLSAGDDIALTAATTIALNGATTLGLGITGGDSSISTTGGDTTVSGLDSFSDVLIDSTGAVNVSGTVKAGRNVIIGADSVTLVDIIQPNNQVVNTVAAGGSVTVTSAGDITGGALAAGGNLTLTADGAIDILQAISGEDAEMALTGTTGIKADMVRSRGPTTLTSDDGNIQINGLSSRDPVSVSANSVDIATNGPVEFGSLVTDVGGATIRATNRLIINSATIAGTARFSDTGEHIIIRNLTAAAAEIDANEMLSMTNVNVTGNLDADAGTTIVINGVVTGSNISLASADIDIDTELGRVGTAGVTQALSVQNNDNQNQTFVGGTGARDGFHIDAAELTRLFGTAIEIFAPEVRVFSPASLGGTSPPDIVVDTFTMTGGTQGSNLGTNGALTITTPGKMRVLGNVQLTGLSDANALNLVADDALEVILGRGTVRLLGANNAPGGVLNMESDDIIVATPAAITDVANAGSMDVINSRLSQNDGVVLDEGSLFARRIAFDVVGGVYVQNSGAGTDFGQRRGLTFGAGGLDVVTEGQSRIVLNGVQLGPNGQITGIDTIALLTVGGSPPPSGGSTGSLGFNAQSTLNGCFIANTAACTTTSIEIAPMFPVQDVIEKQDEDGDGDGEAGDGTTLPTALITMRDLDPLSGEPLLDDPVTGAGNDDLWTPTSDQQP
ncbi:hypothetical protein [Sphingopyxis sp.]|uniref:hypothetical protein n=1 Tax=Sphingopyxis sp. TaxID=1908224 RepID=UPI003BAC327F